MFCSLIKSSKQEAGVHMYTSALNYILCSIFISFFSTCFLTTIGFTFYVITFPVKTTGVSQKILAFHLGANCLLHTTHTVNHTQHSLVVAPMSAHSSKCDLCMLHHSDKYPAYPGGLYTWGVNSRLGRNRLTCQHIR